MLCNELINSALCYSSFCNLYFTDILFALYLQVRNYFVAAGLCSFGISFSAGIGDLLSQWITYDKPINEPNLDIQRFSRDHNNKQYLYNRVKDIVGMLYEISYPRKEVPFARPSKQSVLYGLLDEAGASWGETMGWEKPNLFAINSEGILFPAFFINSPATNALDLTYLVYLYYQANYVMLVMKYTISSLKSPF